MRFKLKGIASSSLLSGAFLTVSITMALADTVPAPIDFHQTVLPILKDSCFACHVSGAAAPYAGSDPVMAKKTKKEVGDGLDALTMGDKFPFPDDDPASKQLKHLEKELSKGFMPPEAQAKLTLGLPLSDKNRKLLLDWVAQEKKANP
ncbi:MAG TPA: heme-binding domain-containing protein [bacterium]|nr:heme-binding domain-containing protein [bacterium]